MCPDTGLIFFMFQRGLGLATEPTRLPKRLTTLSIPRFSLFDRTSGRFGSVNESPINQGLLVKFAPGQLQRRQILSCVQRKQKWTLWGEKACIRAHCRLKKTVSHLAAWEAVRHWLWSVLHRSHRSSSADNIRPDFQWRRHAGFGNMLHRHRWPG